MTIEISTKKELAAAARRLLDFAGPRRKMAFYGEMGMGKTTFIQAICREIGVAQMASSPTFSLINQYVFQEKNGAAGLVHHLDLYRLNKIEEALDIGFDDLLYDASFCFIEWPQLVEPILPAEIVKIYIEPMGETGRFFSYLNNLLYSIHRKGFI